jgi:hypothetical protein
MPGDPKECRLHALECTRIAQSATRRDARDTFTELAQRWLRLADDLEASQKLLEEWGEAPIPLKGRSRSSPRAA